MNPEQEAYMAEILDHLDTLEHNLVDYENKASETGASALIHSMFRSAHSLKSALGMGGFPVSSNMLHSLENIMDNCRISGTAIDPADVDAFLVVLDITRKNLNSTEEVSYTLTGTSADSVVPPVDSSSEAQKSGRWQLHKTVKTSLSPERFAKLPVMKNIAAVGTLVSVDPPLEKWDRAQETVTVTLIFESTESVDSIKELISDPVHPAPAPTAQETGADKQESTASVAAAERTVEDLKILIVEDDFATRHLEASVLGTFGICDIAVDGREAINAFRENLQKKKPYNLVILDINLPEVSGMEVLQAIRSLESDQGIAGLDRSKIAVVSSVSEETNIRKSFKDQADAYIIKPITKKKVKEELARLRIV